MGLSRCLPGGEGLTGPAQPFVTLSPPLPWLAPCLLALVDRQVFGLFAEKVSDPEWKTWLVGFLPVLQPGGKLEQRFLKVLPTKCRREQEPSMQSPPGLGGSACCDHTPRCHLNCSDWLRVMCLLPWGREVQRLRSLGRKREKVGYSVSSCASSAVLSQHSQF